MAYQTMTDFGGVGVVPLMSAIVSAIPIFFDVILFFLWIFLSGASYFAILTSTGKKRFWHSVTSVSFVMFIASLLVASQNTATITFLGAYWVGFYILMTLGSWFMLSNYK